MPANQGFSHPPPQPRQQQQRQIVHQRRRSRSMDYAGDRRGHSGILTRYLLCFYEICYVFMKLYTDIIRICDVKVAVNIMGLRIAMEHI